MMEHQSLTAYDKTTSVADVLDKTLVIQIRHTPRLYDILAKQAPAPKLQALADDYTWFCETYISPCISDRLSFDENYRLYQCDSWLFLFHIIGADQLFVMNLFHDMDQWILFTLPHHAIAPRMQSSSYHCCLQENMLLLMISPIQPSLHFTLDDCFFLDVSSGQAKHVQYVSDTMQDIICVLNMGTKISSQANELWVLMWV